MGSRTDAEIADWQEQAGIKPATGKKAEMLDRLSQFAFELIQLIALEKSGIRDGDGFWHGSDPLDGTIRNLKNLWQANQPRVSREEFKRLEREFGPL